MTSLVDETIQQYLMAADYTTFLSQICFRMALITKYFRSTALEKAYKNATQDYEKRHVTPYIYRSHPEKYKICIINASEELFDPGIRITIDTEEDYALLCLLFDILYIRDEYFDAKDIIRLFKEKPWIKFLNEEYCSKKIFSSEEQEIVEALKIIKDE